jgi:hypothetical protein
MGDNHGGAAAAVLAFPIVPYVLLISYLALVLVLFADLLDVLAYLYVVKLTNAYLMLTSIIKLTQKLLNILTACVCKRRGYSLEGGGRKYGKIRKNMFAPVWHQLSSCVVCSICLHLFACFMQKGVGTGR